MKKILVVFLGVMLLCAFPFMAGAATFTFNQSQLLAMSESYDNPAGIGSLWTITPVGDGALFYGNITDGAPNWRSIGIGFPWGDSNLPGNLTGYTDYKVKFENDNNQTWWVNLYMNTGWTDNPFSLANNTFYQNGWTQLAVGQSAVLTIDLTQVANLHQVTNIGFQFAFDDPKGQGDQYHMLVNVPEPATMLLLGLGLLGLGTMRRKIK